MTIRYADTITQTLFNVEYHDMPVRCPECGKIVSSVRVLINTNKMTKGIEAVFSKRKHRDCPGSVQ